MYKNQPAKRKSALIYTAVVLSKAWKYPCVSHLQNPDLASLCKGFRSRYTATQLQTGFLLTSTGHLAQKDRSSW